jgi:hypothetical protein
MSLVPPAAVELPLSGPLFERAVVLAHEAVTSAIFGGPAGEGSLEFVLTEAANNPVVGSALSLLLTNMAAQLAMLLGTIDLEEADGASEPDADLVRTRAVALVDSLLATAGDGFRHSNP